MDEHAQNEMGVEARRKVNPIEDENEQGEKAEKKEGRRSSLTAEGNRFTPPYGRLLSLVNLMTTISGFVSIRMGGPQVPTPLEV